MRKSCVVLALAALVCGCGRGPSLPFGKAADQIQEQVDSAVSEMSAAASAPSPRPVAVKTPLVDMVVVYDGHEARDPFVPPKREAESVVVTQHDALSLQMIIEGGAKPLAVISGERVTIGDTIQGCVVKEIADGRVFLEFEGESFEITAN